MLRFLGLACAAWILPAAFHLLHVDWMSLPLLFFGTASLVRGGVALFDRLMLTCVLLLGEVITAGLLFSFWPWGLHPVPMAGTLLTVTLVVAWVTGRRPTLPRRVLPTDLLALALAAYASAQLYRPLRGRSPNERLLYTVVTEDKGSHFSMFDAIHRVGGYTYFHAAEASTSMNPQMARVYPPGSHFLYTVLDTFLRSTTDAGPAAEAYDRYFLYTILGYGFLVLALVWAARWIAGPTVTGWRRALVCAVVGTVAATGQLIGVFTLGHDSASLGIAVLALTIAVLVRPAGRVREQVLVVGAALVTLAFVYNLFVVSAAPAVLVAAVVYRRRLRTAPVFTTIVGTITGVIVLIPIVGPQLTGFSQTKQLQATGGIEPMSRNLVAACIVITVASLLTRAGRRSPVWRVMSAQLVLATAAVGAFHLYQTLTLGETSYYYEKAFQGLYSIALIGIGSIGLLLRPTLAPEPENPRLRPLARSATGLAAVVAGVTLVGGIQWGPVHTAEGANEPDTTYAARWSSGFDRQRVGETAKVLRDRGLFGTGPSTLFVYSDTGTDNWRISFLDAILKRRLGSLDTTVTGIPWLAGLASYGQGGRSREQEARRLELVVRDSPKPLRLVITNKTLAERFERLATAQPELLLEVVRTPAIE
ncbi:hypothetical protein ACFZBU_36935 [Embleya sp. NPDC008237]|uniref:hypothetical protein n=1 Tax=Embleya sp. NPDC008237 TaxID=3363978 RepID=UPI0036E91D80